MASESNLPIFCYYKTLGGLIGCAVFLEGPAVIRYTERGEDRIVQRHIIELDEAIDFTLNGLMVKYPYLGGGTLVAEYLRKAQSEQDPLHSSNPDGGFPDVPRSGSA